MTTPRAGTLLVGRVADQGALGLSLLLLAARLDVASFGLVSILFVFNSFAVTLAHYGLGQAVLRLPPGASLPRRLLRTSRVVNVVLAVVTLLVAIAVGGREGAVAATAGLIWALAGEVHVRKAEAVAGDRPVSVAVGEITGSVVLLLGSALVPADVAVLAMGMTLAGKHLVEGLVLGAPSRFDAPSGGRWPYGLMLTQALAQAAANVDYLVAWALLGPRALGFYTLAFRVVNLVPSQVSNVTSRLALVEFGRSERAERASYYSRVTGQLFLGGLAAAAVTGGVAPVLPEVLGERWREVVPFVQVLAIALPWRLVMGVAGALAIGVGLTRQLVGWEAVRLVATTIVLASAAAVGVEAFVAAVTIVAAVSCAVLHRAVAPPAEVRAASWMPAAVVVSVAGAVFGAMITRG